MTFIRVRNGNYVNSNYVVALNTLGDNVTEVVMTTGINRLADHNTDALALAAGLLVPPNPPTPREDPLPPEEKTPQQIVDETTAGVLEAQATPEGQYKNPW